MITLTDYFIASRIEDYMNSVNLSAWLFLMKMCKYIKWHRLSELSFAPHVNKYVY